MSSETLRVIRPCGSGQPAPADALCDCGESALSLCGTGGDYPTVVHCLKPVCQPDGHWCNVHRHAPGTMTYAMMNQEVRMEFENFGSNGTLRDALVTWFWNRWPLKWKLRELHAQLLRAHPPPAPLPKFIVTYKGRRFVAKNSAFVEEKS